MNTIAGDLSLVSVATIAEMSPTHLSRLFKSILGVNFKDFVTGVRIRTARHYLEETAMLVYEIAERVGIPDGRYFSDVFRREVGCTPSEYRARAARTFGLPAVETIRP
jgi:two-component system response regulator YesN